jgi:hypothetical protein
LFAGGSKDGKPVPAPRKQHSYSQKGAVFSSKIILDVADIYDIVSM